MGCDFYADRCRREHLLAQLRRQERDEHLEPGRGHRRAQKLTVALLPEAAAVVAVALALAPRVGDGPDDHLARDRQEGEGRAHDREQARAEVVGRAVDLRAEDLDDREDAGRDPGGADLRR